jgi:hypothetical protein
MEKQATHLFVAIWHYDRHLLHYWGAGYGKQSGAKYSK